MRVYPAILMRAAELLGDTTDLVAAVLDDFGIVALEEMADGTALRAFFASAAARDDAARALARAFPSMAVESLDVSDEDWAARSQAALKAVRVGAMTVAPPWDVPAGDASTTIIILPSTGFGTGHHATTRLCLAALQRAEPAGKTVIDVGTGSGVLALAAAKLGALRAVGIDNDQDAIDNALENRGLNGAPEVEFRTAGLEESAAEGPFDIVLANLTGATLIALAAPLKRLVGVGGRLIVSGLREEEEQAVVRSIGFASAGRGEEEGWICLVLIVGEP